jgi:hypothetical protein
MYIQPVLCANALRKVALLITKAADLGMDLTCYGNAAENENNGNVYLWLEEYTFTLYIPLCSDDAIHACWSSGYTDDEETIEVGAMTLHDLEAWGHDLNVKADKKESADA